MKQPEMHGLNGFNGLSLKFFIREYKSMNFEKKNDFSQLKFYMLPKISTILYGKAL